MEFKPPNKFHRKFEIYCPAFLCKFQKQMLKRNKIKHRIKKNRI